MPTIITTDQIAATGYSIIGSDQYFFLPNIIVQGTTSDGIVVADGATSKSSLIVHSTVFSGFGSGDDGIVLDGEDDLVLSSQGSVTGEDGIVLSGEENSVTLNGDVIFNDYGIFLGSGSDNNEISINGNLSSVNLNSFPQAVGIKISSSDGNVIQISGSIDSNTNNFASIIGNGIEIDGTSRNNEIMISGSVVAGGSGANSGFGVYIAASDSSITSDLINTINVTNTGLINAEAYSSGDGISVNNTQSKLVSNMAGTILADSIGIDSSGSVDLSISGSIVSGGDAIEVSGGDSEIDVSGVLNAGSDGIETSGEDTEINVTGVIEAGASAIETFGGNTSIYVSGALDGGVDGVSVSGEDAFVQVSGTIQAGSVGIESGAANTRVNVSGNVASQFGSVLLGSTGGHFLSVAGTVMGFTDGAMVFGASNRVTVSGEGQIIGGSNRDGTWINSEDPAALTFRSELGQSNVLVNAGTILGEYNPDENSATAIIDNLEGDLRTADFATSGDLTIDNTGQIIGDIRLGAGTDVYNGGAGKLGVGSLLDLGAGDDTAVAGWGDDLIDAGDGADFARGGDGNDTINGGGDADTLIGDAGNDTLDGGAGADDLFGWLGNDTLRGGGDNDRLFGQQGDDEIDGGEGNGAARGGEGSDTIFGWVGNDFLFGDEGDDRLFGQGDDDELFGWSGNDQLFGDTGNDKLFGQDGNDFMVAWEGDDLLIGGKGNDEMDGQAGADRFEFFADDFEAGGRDVILAYDAADTYAFKGHPNITSLNVVSLGPDARIEVNLADGGIALIDVLGATVADVNANVTFF